MRNYILGGGVTGLSAGLKIGLPVFEAMSDPGGICSSYYVRPGESTRLAEAPVDGEAYRFEIVLAATGFSAVTRRFSILSAP